MFASVLLKRYFPAEFNTSVLNNLPGMYQERVLLHDARRCGISVLPPDINRSASGYALEIRAIRVGLKGVRNMGPANLGKILEERDTRPFEDLNDFCRRLRVNQNLLRSMILSGLFDAIFRPRLGLFRLLAQGAPAAGPEGDEEEFSLAEKVGHELEHLGLDLSAHVMSLHRGELDRRGIITCADLKKSLPGPRVAVAGVKILLHTPPTRSGIRVGGISLEDETGVADIAVFPDAKARDGPTLFTAKALVVRGKVTRMAVSHSVTAERIAALEDALPAKSGQQKAERKPRMTA